MREHRAGSHSGLARRVRTRASRPRAAKSGPRAAKSGPRADQERPKSSQEPPKSDQERPRATQERPREAQGRVRTAKMASRAAKKGPRRLRPPRRAPQDIFLCGSVMCGIDGRDRDDLQGISKLHPRCSRTYAVIFLEFVRRTNTLTHSERGTSHRGGGGVRALRVLDPPPPTKYGTAC